MVRKTWHDKGLLDAKKETLRIYEAAWKIYNDLLVANADTAALIQAQGVPANAEKHADDGKFMLAHGKYTLT
jgi:hypothetical protein